MNRTITRRQVVLSFLVGLAVAVGTAIHLRPEPLSDSFGLALFAGLASWLIAFMALEEPVGKVTDTSRNAGAHSPGTHTTLPFEEQLVIYPDVHRLRWIALCGLAVVAFSIEMAWFAVIDTPVRADSWALAGLAIICTLYCGWYLGFAMVGLLTRRPFLTFSSAGLLDQSSALAVGFIPWGEIGRVAVRVRGRQSYIGINLVHSDVILSRLNPMHRLWLRCNARLVGYLVNIPTNALRERTGFLVDLIIEGASGGTSPKTTE